MEMNGPARSTSRSGPEEGAACDSQRHVDDARPRIFGKRDRSSSVTAAGEIELWDVASGRAQTFELYPANAMAFSSDGRKVAGFNQLGALAIWDVSTFGPRLDVKHGITHHTDFGVRHWTTAAFSPDGRTLATNGGESAIHFWDIATKRDSLAMPETHCARPNPFW